jgi:O-antigen ligase
VGARQLPLTALARRELALSALAAAATAVFALAGMHKLGTAGVLAPLVVVLGVILLMRPLVAVSLVVVLVIACEGPTFGLLTFTAQLYVVYKDITPVDVLVVLAVAAVGIDMVRNRRPLRVPRPLIVPDVTLAAAMIVGVVVGHAAGASLRFAATSEHVLAYLLFLPLAVANLELDRDRLKWLLGGALLLASAKAVLGLIELAGHLGTSVEGGTTTLTYYEPTANWLIMIAVLAIFAALLARVKPPLWMLLASPLLVACLLLSYRRSFWIGTGLGVLLVLMLGTTPVGRRLLVPAALAVAVAVWVLGSIHFQSQSAIVKRASSLNPSKLEASAQDRYRLDERANVLTEIAANPITGLGVTIPWKATTQTLSIETGAEGRQYVHFAALWFWLKLGILGLFAYVGIMIGSMWVAWQAWRASHEPLLRAFALASLCGMAGLLVMDTTASFTGVEARFTVLFAAQVGLLALIASTAGQSRELQPDGGLVGG